MARNWRSQMHSSPRSFRRWMISTFLLASINCLGQTRPAQPAASSSATEPSVAALEQRIAVLEERLKGASALKEQERRAISDRIEDIYKLMQFVGVVITALLVFFSIRDVLLRRKEGER